MLLFTIRDVLRLTLVVGLAVAWAVDRGRVAEDRALWVARYHEQHHAAIVAEEQVRALLGISKPVGSP